MPLRVHLDPRSTAWNSLPDLGSTLRHCETELLAGASLLAGWRHSILRPAVPHKAGAGACFMAVRQSCCETERTGLLAGCETELLAGACFMTLPARQLMRPML